MSKDYTQNDKIIRSIINRHTALTDENITLIGSSGTCLHLAIYRKNYVMAKEIIHKGAATLPDDDGITPLMLLCTMTNVPEAIDLINEIIATKRTDINFCKKDGNTALHIAINKKNIEAAKILIAAKAFNLPNEQGIVPFEMAKQQGLTEIAQMILDVAYELSTPLHATLMSDAFELATDIILQGGQTNEEDSSGTTPWMIAVRKCNVDIIHLMLQYDIFRQAFYAQDEHGNTDLHRALQKKHISLIKVFLDNNPNFVKNDEGQTPLMLAAAIQDASITQTMIHYYSACKNSINDIDQNGNTALYIAMLNKNFSVAKYLIEHGALNITNKDGVTPWILAINQNNIPILECMMTYCNLYVEEINSQGNNGNTALHKAIEHKNTSFAIKLLLQHAAGNIANVHGKTPEYLAYTLKNHDVQLEMLRIGMFKQFINAQDQYGNTMLHEAIKNNNQPLAIQLIANDAHNIANDAGETPLKLTVKKGYIDVLKQMIKMPSYQQDLHKAYEHGNTLLHIALSDMRNISLANALIEHGLINAGNNAGQTPWKIAIENENIQLIIIMLQYMQLTIQDIQYQNTNGNTALHIVIPERSLANISLDLINRGILNIPNNNNKTPLILAVEKGAYTIAEALLQNNIINLDYQDSAGNTALHYAIWNIQLTEILLEFGAKSIKNYKNKEPIQYTKDDSIIRVLINHKALQDVNAQDENGNTLLHRAVENYNISIVKKLILIKARNIENHMHNTPFDIALRQNHKNIVDFFLQEGVVNNISEYAQFYITQHDNLMTQKVSQLFKALLYDYRSDNTVPTILCNSFEDLATTSDLPLDHMLIQQQAIFACYKTLLDLTKNNEAYSNKAIFMDKFFYDCRKILLGYQYDDYLDTIIHDSVMPVWIRESAIRSALRHSFMNVEPITKYLTNDPEFQHTLNTDYDAFWEAISVNFSLLKIYYEYHTLMTKNCNDQYTKECLDRWFDILGIQSIYIAEKVLEACPNLWLSHAHKYDKFKPFDSTYAYALYTTLQTRLNDTQNDCIEFATSEYSLLILKNQCSNDILIHIANSAIQEDPDKAFEWIKAEKYGGLKKFNSHRAYEIYCKYMEQVDKARIARAEQCIIINDYRLEITLPRYDIESVVLKIANHKANQEKNAEFKEECIKKFQLEFHEKIAKAKADGLQKVELYALSDNQFLHINQRSYDDEGIIRALVNRAATLESEKMEKSAPPLQKYEFLDDMVNSYHMANSDDINKKSVVAKDIVSKYDNTIKQQNTMNDNLIQSIIKLDIAKIINNILTQQKQKITPAMHEFVNSIMPLDVKKEEDSYDFDNTSTNINSNIDDDNDSMQMNIDINPNRNTITHDTTNYTVQSFFLQFKDKIANTHNITRLELYKDTNNKQLFINKKDYNNDKLIMTLAKCAAMLDTKVNKSEIMDDFHTTHGIKREYEEIDSIIFDTDAYHNDKRSKLGEHNNNDDDL